MAGEEQNENFEDIFAGAFQDASVAENVNLAPPKKEEVEAKPAEQQPEAKAEEKVEAKAEEKVEGEEQPEAKAEEKAEGEEEAEGEEQPEEKPAPKVEAKKDEVSDKDVLSRLAKLVQETKPEPKPAPKQEEAEPAKVYTPEEEEVLQSYEKEWPDVAKAEALRRRGEYRQLVSFVFQEVAKEIKPLLEVVDLLAAKTQIADLKEAVPDYSEELATQVEAWVEKQPAYLQPAYKQVINSGTKDEVADLISRYKADTGVAKPAPKAPAKKDTELPSSTKQAAAALAPVSSKRSAISQTADPNDFDGAFSEFAKTL